MRQYPFLLILMMFLFLASCEINKKSVKSELSFIGKYSDLVAKDKVGFSTDIRFEGVYSFIENDSFPLLKIVFNNYTAGDIIMDFPFNWHDKFIKDPALFEFIDNEISEVKTLNFINMNYSPVQVLLPVQNSLTINVIADERIINLALESSEGYSKYRVCINYRECQRESEISHCSEPVFLIESIIDKN